MVSFLSSMSPLLWVVIVSVGVFTALLVKQKQAAPTQGDVHQGKPRRSEAKTHLGPQAVAAKAKHARPSVAVEPSWKHKLHLAPRVPVHELGVYVGDLADVWNPSLGGWEPRRVELFAPIEDSQILVGPPGSGKTLKLRRTIAEFPGPVVATSTKLDILKHTARRRAWRFGRRSVHLFNPRRLGNQRKFRSTIKFSVVGGCEDPAVAQSRAGYLLCGVAAASANDKQTDFWNGHANKVLRAFLFVAAHHNLSILTVKQWVNRKDETPLRMLERIEGEVAASMLDELTQIMGEYDRFKGSVFATLSQVFDAFSDEGVRAIVDLKDGEQDFDAVGFLRRRETLYLIGEQEDNASISPLFCALAGAIYEAAKAIGQRNGDRLDPPVLFALDEAPNIATLPLHRMTSVARGLGITFVLGIQQERQLHDVWGENRGSIIWTNCPVKLIFGGTHDDAFLEKVSALIGDYEHISTSTTTPGGDGQKPTTTTTYTPRRIWPVGALRKLAENHALALVGREPAVEVQFTPFHEDRGYLRRERREMKRLTPLAPPPNPGPGRRLTAPPPTEEIATITALRPRVAEEAVEESSGG